MKLHSRKKVRKQKYIRDNRATGRKDIEIFVRKYF